MVLKPVQPASKPEGRSRREQQRLETRERLYEAARDEFRRVGFAQAQIDHIAEKAGVARGTFYFHFNTKEHVLFEMQRRHEVTVVERIAAARERSRSVREFLVAVLDAIVAETESVAEPALSREIMAMYVRAPQYVDQSAEPLIVAVVDYFDDAADRGEVRSDIAPEEVTSLFLTGLFGFIVSSIDAMQERRPDFERFIDVFVRGISP